MFRLRRDSIAPLYERRAGHLLIEQNILYHNTTVVNVPGAGASPFRVLTEGEEQGGSDGKRI